MKGLLVSRSRFCFSPNRLRPQGKGILRCLEAGAILQLAESLLSLHGAGGIVVHTCNLRTRKKKAGGYKSRSCSNVNLRPCLKKLSK